MLEFKEGTKSLKGDRLKGRNVTFFCFVKDCIHHTNSGAVMYDHLRIVHNFMLFKDRQIEA